MVPPAVPWRWASPAERSEAPPREARPREAVRPSAAAERSEAPSP